MTALRSSTPRIPGTRRIPGRSPISPSRVPASDADYGAVTLGLVPVSVTHRVIGYLRRRPSGEVIDFIELDMPEQTLPTTAVMYTIDPEALRTDGIEPSRIPGALHAAEHAAIGLLPLVASCDRGDIGGLSTAVGEDGLPTVFVYDGHPGGAGFAERGYRLAETWLRATLRGDRGLRMPAGCPSCVQSPKCGNGNDPLDKAGAVGCSRRCWHTCRGATPDPRPPTDPSSGRQQRVRNSSGRNLLPPCSGNHNGRSERSDNAIRSASSS